MSSNNSGSDPEIEAKRAAYRAALESAYAAVPPLRSAEFASYIEGADTKALPGAVVVRLHRECLEQGLEEEATLLRERLFAVQQWPDSRAPLRYRYLGPVRYEARKVVQARERLRGMEEDIFQMVVTGVLESMLSGRKTALETSFSTVLRMRVLDAVRTLTAGQDGLADSSPEAVDALTGDEPETAEGLFAGPLTEWMHREGIEFFTRHWHKYFSPTPLSQRDLAAQLGQGERTLARYQNGEAVTKLRRYLQRRQSGMPCSPRFRELILESDASLYATLVAIAGVR